MRFGSRIMNVDGVQQATVTMQSGDSLSVGYVDSNGNTHILNINAQHLVLMVSHEQTDATMIFRPAVGVQYIAPTK